VLTRSGHNLGKPVAIDLQGGKVTGQAIRIVQEVTRCEGSPAPSGTFTIAEKHDLIAADLTGDVGE
ncbi:uncharacterized protein METZ01_LOCUS176208, partial [marine metagenome]